MHNARLRLMAGLAGATLSLFAAASYGQTPATTQGDASAQTTAQPTPPVTPDPSATATDPITPATPTDIGTTTETTGRGFPGGIWGILAVSLLVLFALVALFRGRNTTVVKETYTSTGTAPGTRTVGMGTTADDRNLTPRAASGTEAGTRGGMSDPNTRL